MHKCTKAGCSTLRRASAALYRASFSPVGSSPSRAVFRPAPIQTRQLEQPQLALPVASHLVDQISHDFGLNDEQRAALRCDKQHIRLRAGPGSGKTLSAAAYAFLAVNGAQQQGLPKKVLAITFTNAARDELEKRVQEKAPGVNVGERLHVTTIHGLCTEILGTYRKHPGGPGPFTIASESNRQRVIEDILENSDKWELNRLDESNRKHLVKMFLDKISAVKIHVERIHDTSGNLRHGDALIPVDMSAAGTDMVPDDVVTSPASWKSREFPQELARVYNQYSQEMARRGLVDFEDLLHLTLRLLEQNHKVRNELQARYHTILVDEAQDLNKCQHAILKELTGATTRTIMVGDPEQCIFLFTGSEPSAWLEPIFNGQPVSELFLSKNHRSVRPIVQLGDCAKRVTRLEATCGAWLSPLLKDFISGQAVRADPVNYNHAGNHAGKLMGFPSPQEEVKTVVDLVKNSKPSELNIGVLFARKSDIVTAIREALTAEGIPFTFEDGNAFLQLNEVKAADALLRLVVDPDNADLHLRSLIDLRQQEGWELPLLKDLNGSTCTKLKQLSVSSNSHDSGSTATLASQLYDSIDHARAADIAAKELADVALPYHLKTVGLMGDKQQRHITKRGKLTDAELAALQRLWAFVTVIRAVVDKKPTQAAVKLMLSASGLTTAIANSSGDGARVDDTSALDRLENLEAYIAAGTDDQPSSDTSSTAIGSDGRSPSGLDQLAQYHQRIMLKSRTDGRLGSGQVQMTTVHKAKGREWDMVILVDARSLWFNDGTPKREIQQLCNVFYTAISRPKDQVYVTWNTEFGNKKGGYAATQIAIASAFVGNAADSNGVTQDQDAVYDGASGTPRGDGSSQASKQGFSAGASTSRKRRSQNLTDLICAQLSENEIEGVEVMTPPRK